MRDYLGGFGFVGDKALEAVAPFSGGEKSRLVLALLVYQRPNLLLLDEPTNHLDLEMRQALATALQGFEGAMVVVSHDRHLLRLTCDQLLLVHSGRVEEFADELDAYASWLTTHNRAARRPHPGRPAATDQRRERKRRAAERRQALQPMRRALEACEARVESLHAEQTKLETILADTGLYDERRKHELQNILRDKAAVDQQLAVAEADWLEAAEALQQAEE
jgi:ATP-binding cassette subfamily F protein 3